jgi:adenylyl-sulfate kinase
MNTPGGHQVDIASASLGVTVWITGLPSAGKTTLAAAVRTLAEGACVVLDGDELRATVNADLGFTRSDRAESCARVAALALRAASSGALVVVAHLSPYATDRAAARAIHRRAGVRFLEIYVDTAIDECQRRDPKGLYAQAAIGRLDNLTGVGDSYEPPRAPDMRFEPGCVLAHAREVLRRARPEGCFPAPDESRPRGWPPCPVHGCASRCSELAHAA